MICASPIILIKLLGAFLMTPKYGNARYTNGDDQPRSGAWFTLLAIHSKISNLVGVPCVELTVRCGKTIFIDHFFSETFRDFHI